MLLVLVVPSNPEAIKIKKDKTMIQHPQPFATLLEQKDDHAQIEEAFLEIRIKVPEKNWRLEEIDSLNTWHRVLKNAQPALQQFLLQQCQLLRFDRREAVISVPEGYRPQEKEKSFSIEALFRKVGHPAKVRFMFKPHP
ncbi:MAG: hypothetical protein V7K24_00785 [Nostoc sp.]